MKTNNKKIEIKNSSSAKSSKQCEENEICESLILKPVGYPFNFSLMENDLEITNEELFEEYAREQWLGLFVKEDSYLFDQKIVPDYGFKILTAIPNNSIIGEETKIAFIKDEIANNLDLPPISTNIKFEDVIGQENAKNKIKVLMKFIENPDKFGLWAPKNILFYGLPGTGKTMLVKALANELNIPLYLIKSTSLIGDHVGDGASKIHDLFEKAAKNSPAIIFIDEIDAIALHRSFQSLRGDVSEIVNSLLTEMDGISQNNDLITIGATNNPTFLDYAVRSRFEEEIEFKLPNENERAEIISRNIETFPYETDFNVNHLVNLTKNMSGRDIKEKILKTSLHHAISQDKEIVDMEDINYALKVSNIAKNEVKGMFE